MPAAFSDVDEKLHRRAWQLSSLAVYLVENANQAEWKATLAQEPMAMVMRHGALELRSGNQLIFIDMNSFGDTDHRPDVRTCPLPNLQMKKMCQPVLQIVSGNDNPKFIPKGMVFAFIDAGKDRKKFFLKEMPMNQPKKDQK